MKKNINKYLVISLVLPFLGQLGCGKREGGGVDGGSTNIQKKGSDTMLQLAQAWSEMYSAKNPDVRVAVSGGGSGTGIAGLINGVVDVANCSRSIKPAEEAEIQEKHGVKPKEYIMGLDCLAVFVHKDNPIEKITIECEQERRQLSKLKRKEIYKIMFPKLLYFQLPENTYFFKKFMMKLCSYYSPWLSNKYFIQTILCGR